MAIAIEAALGLKSKFDVPGMESFLESAKAKLGEVCDAEEQKAVEVLERQVLAVENKLQEAAAEETSSGRSSRAQMCIVPALNSETVRAGRCSMVAKKRRG